MVTKHKTYFCKTFICHQKLQKKQKKKPTKQKQKMTILQHNRIQPSDEFHIENFLTKYGKFDKRSDDFIFFGEKIYIFCFLFSQIQINIERIQIVRCVCVCV